MQVKEFEKLLSKEVAVYKSLIESETNKLLNSTKIYQSFMDNMIHISGQFTASLGNQMKEMMNMIRSQAGAPSYRAVPYGGNTDIHYLPVRNPSEARDIYDIPYRPEMVPRGPVRPPQFPGYLPVAPERNIYMPGISGGDQPPK